MNSDGWKEFKVGELYDIFSGLSKPRDQFGFGYPFVTFKDVFQNYFLPDELTSLANTNEKEIKSCSVKKGDIFLTRTSETQHELGMSSVALKDYENATFNGFTKRLRLKKEAKINIDPIYMGYFLRSPYFRSQVAQHSSLTTRASLNSTTINSLKILLPDAEVQKSIGKILKSLDDKIELNRQTNQTLEAIAQSIFKEWFVDFNFPGVTGEKQDGELREIPKGWRVGKLGEVCELVYGKALKAENRIEGKYPVVGSSGIVDFHNEYLVTAPGIVIGRKGTIGEVTWLYENFYPIDTTFYVQDRIGVDYLSFHYFLLKEQDFKRIASDSAVPGLNRSQAMNNDVVIPTKETVDSFHSVVAPIFASLNTLEEQTKTLTQLRDTLLPKLMKGELKP